MSSQSEVYTDGNRRYFRLGSILQTEGKLAISLFLETYFLGKTFTDYLKNTQVKSKLLSLLRRKILKKEQYDLLYPKTGQTDLKSLDISLLYMLIRSLHPTLSPNDIVWTEHNVGIMSPEADVTRISLTRNRIWGHADGLEITEDELTCEVQDLEAAITRLARSVASPSINPADITERIRDRLTANFDPEPVRLDASTSTSSLQKKRKLSSRIKSYIDPFIIKPKVQHIEKNEMLPCKNKSITDYKQSPSKEPKMSCHCMLTGKRRFSQASFFHTNNHMDLEHRCLLVGVVRLHNGVVIVTDAAHNCVQAFDKNNDLIDEIECPNPRGVCAISEDSVMICLSQSSKMMIYKCDTSLHYVDDVSVTCDGRLYDVKFANSCAYVLCEKGEIHLINLKKSTEDRLRIETGSNVEFFDISPSGDKIFLSDGKGVVCMDDSGLELWHYRGTGAKLKTTGVVAHKDRLIVAAWEDNKLIELTQNGKWVREVGVDYVQCPMALNQNGGEVCITQYMSNLNEDICREVVILRE